MAEVLQRFISSLRDHELPISTAESLDALRAAANLGYHNKQRLRLGLRSALVKHAEHQRCFDDCFAIFFGNSPHSEATDSPAQLQAESITGSGAAPPALEDPELVIARAASLVDLDQLRLFTQRGLYLRRLLQAAETDIPAGADDEYREQLQQAARAKIERALEITGKATARDIQRQVLRRVNLSHLEQHQYFAMQQMVLQLARRLARQLRRQRRRYNTGKLDLGRTLRRNLPHQGIPIELHWRHQRQRRARLFVCCDISGSVARHARWLLLLLHSLGEVMPATRSFVFTGTTHEVSKLFAEQAPEQAIEQALKAYGSGGSDYGRSLESLYPQIAGALRRNSTLLILGDARNNQADTRVDLLQQLAARAGRVFWLNPEQRALWDTGDSVAGTYRRHCQRFLECGNLAQLERAVSSLLLTP